MINWTILFYTWYMWLARIVWSASAFVTASCNEKSPCTVEIEYVHVFNKCTRHNSPGIIINLNFTLSTESKQRESVILPQITLLEQCCKYLEVSSRWSTFPTRFKYQFLYFCWDFQIMFEITAGCQPWDREHHLQASLPRHQHHLPGLLYPGHQCRVHWEWFSHRVQPGR